MKHDSEKHHRRSVRSYESSPRTGQVGDLTLTIHEAVVERLDSRLRGNDRRGAGEAPAGGTGGVPQVLFFYPPRLGDSGG